MTRTLSILLMMAATVSFSKMAKADWLFENPDGNAALTLIQAAHSSLDIEVYTMSDPVIQSAIIQAQERGVKVRIIQEPHPVESHCSIFGPPSSKDESWCSEDRSFVQQVISNGGQYIPFNKMLCGQPNSNCFEHGKMLISDGEGVLISSGNFDATNLCDRSVKLKQCDRDYSYVTQDAGIASTLEQIFQSDLAGSPYNLQAILSQSAASMLTVSPYSLSPLVNFINSATSSIQIEEQYLWQNDVNQAIMNTAQRGVHVEVMVESACAYGKPSANEASQFQQTFSAFEQAGVTVRMFTKNNKVSGLPGYLHAKAIVVDGNRAWVGSVNGSDTATSDNREFGAFFTNPSLVQGLSGYLQSDFQNSGSETWQNSVNCAENHKR